MAAVRAGSMLLVLLLASPILPGPWQAGAQPQPFAGDAHVVIAVVDTGINPYHAEFQAPGRSAHPATYLTGYPPDALALDLCLETAPPCDSVAGALHSDAATWSAVPRGALHWLPGTRIVGAISVAEPGSGLGGPRRIFDDAGHGTATASLAAGSTLGLCPECLIVVIEGPGEEALRWARAQPWIDVVTNSWGWIANLGWPPPPVGSANAQTTLDLVRQGKSVLFSAGNGPGLALAPGVTDIPDYLLPGESTYTSEYSGPDWVLTVGAVDPANGQPVAGTGRPVDMVAAGIDVPAASHAARSGAVGFAGTSASTPLVAGALGHALLEVRRALGDVEEGPRVAAGQDEVLAHGPAPIVALPGSALADGVLTRAELERVVLATARPCAVGPHPDLVGPQPHDFDALQALGCPALRTWPMPGRVWGWSVPTPPVAYPLLVGYGTVDRQSRDAAVRVAMGLEPLAPRPAADLWARSDSVVRQQLWGPWEHGAGIMDLARP